MFECSAVPVTLTFSTALAAPAAHVWAAVTSVAGINGELLPLVRMTFPPRFEELARDDVPPGQVVGRCWLLAGGVLPFDRHALAFESFRDEPGPLGYGFVEESSSWVQRRWRHERAVVPRGPERCEVTDRLTVEPRLAATAPLVERLVRRVFAHRHRRLVDRWGQG